jgi:hypothetical protein
MKLQIQTAVKKSRRWTSPFDDSPGRHGNLNRDALLTGKAGVELVQPAPNDLLRMQLVSKRVNVSGRGDDDPGLVEPVEDERPLLQANADWLSS